MRRSRSGEELGPKGQVAQLNATQRKLEEARFFVTLLKRVEDAGPITKEKLDDEATFLFSALINATYSVLECLAEEGKQALRRRRDRAVALQSRSLVNEIGTVKEGRPVLYGGPKSGRNNEPPGLRALSVHHKMVDTQHREHTAGMLGSAPFGQLRFGAVETARSLYVLDPGTESPVQIVPLMVEHLRELEQLVARWENEIRSDGE